MKLETGCRSTNRLLTELILSLDPSVSEKTRLFTVKEYSPGMKRTFCPRHSSCLRFQLFRVEMRSFLPEGEGDGRDLSRQREASHGRLHTLAEQTLIEIVKRSLSAAGHSRRPFEDSFHIVIVISIEPT